MADVHQPETRSYNMSQVKAKDTKPEMIVRKFLHSNGFRYRLHGKRLPGKPDIVLPKYNTVIFVHGCFWHAHKNCSKFSIPKTRSEFWEKKLFGNRDRDEHHRETLKESGWNVQTIWECQLDKSNRLESLNKLIIDLENSID